MPAVRTESFAGRVAKRLGIDPACLAGAGPDGTVTLADVLNEAGREMPVAARRPSSTDLAGGAEGAGEETARERRRLEVVCDAAPLRGVCDALAAVTPEPPDVFALVVRLGGAALRDVPVFPRSAHPGGAPESGEPDAARPTVRAAGPGGRTAAIRREAHEGETNGAGEQAVLTFGEEGETVHLGLEFDTGAVSEAVGEAFLHRLLTLCLDPRRALL